MSFAIVFCGQGTQHPAMLPWLADDDLVGSMCSIVGVSDWRDRLKDASWAASNANAQVLLTGLALAAWQQIRRMLPPPACVAGYSVGELASFSAAGVFDASTALSLAQARALAMDRCAEQAPGGLLAVSGASRTAIDELCDACGVAIAIRNGPDSVVLGGPHAALERAEHAAGRRGARATRLCVSVASHTPWMRAAALAFAQTLAKTPLSRPRTVLISNARQQISSAEQAGAALAEQIAATVRWDDCIENIHARRPDCVLEIGAGQALSRMWNQRFPQIPARSCDDFRSSSAIVEWIGAMAP